MKGLLLTALIAGATAALVIYFGEERSSPERELNDIGDAAEDAFTTMNRNLRKIEGAAGDLLDPALG